MTLANKKDEAYLVWEFDGHNPVMWENLKDWREKWAEVWDQQAKKLMEKLMMKL